MEYRITKDCGVWWDVSVPDTFAWGVSKNQHSLATKIAPGDILLHFIDSARAWAGYSTVTGEIKPNDRDPEEDWRAALPFAIPINRGVWLNRNQCSITVSIDGLSGSNYHRQRAFTAMKAEDARLIITAIEAAAGKEPTPSPEFVEKWNKDAEQYYWEIVRGQSGGKCWLCGTTAATWIADRNLPIPPSEVETIVDQFLDIAHIEARADKGKMSPDNVRPLCPNCHRIVDRIPKKSRMELLRGPR